MGSYGSVLMGGFSSVDSYVRGSMGGFLPAAEDPYDWVSLGEFFWVGSYG